VAVKEEDIYDALGLPFIEPELREGRGEIGQALKGELPKLVTDRDLHGIPHCHTDASDGTETLETMETQRASISGWRTIRSRRITPAYPWDHLLPQGPLPKDIPDGSISYGLRSAKLQGDSGSIVWMAFLVWSNSARSCCTLGIRRWRISSTPIAW
jgi:hypothetical protein